MLFMAKMETAFPPHLNGDEILTLESQERMYGQELQRSGVIQSVWRIVGEYANYCLFDVSNNDELHNILRGLPMFSYMKIKVTALATHPNAILRE